jgi:hypothetical protein
MSKRLSSVWCAQCGQDTGAWCFKDDGFLPYLLCSWCAMKLKDYASMGRKK